MTKFHIAHISGGVASWLAAKRAAAKYGRERMILLFADTRAEEKSTYRFIEQCVADIGTCYGFHVLADGRNPWEVFRDERFLGNSRVDPCSKILKRQLVERWVHLRFTPDNCVQHFGFDWTEEHRLAKLRERFDPWPVEALLMEPPYLSKRDMILEAERCGLPVPLLYRLGFEHNNCGGKCVKAGQAHFAKLYSVLPESYAEVEREESKLRSLLGDVSILRDRTGGVSTPLSLVDFRKRIEDKNFDMFDFGACSCFSDPAA